MFPRFGALLMARPHVEDIQPVACCGRVPRRTDRNWGGGGCAAWSVQEGGVVHADVRMSPKHFLYPPLGRTGGDSEHFGWKVCVLPLSTASAELGSPKMPFFYFFHPFLETVLLSAGSGRVRKQVGERRVLLLAQGSASASPCALLWPGVDCFFCLCEAARRGGV